MTRQQAINEHCKSCIYDANSGLGNWRQQTSACTCTQCHLYHYRPKSKPKDAATGILRQQTTQSFATPKTQQFKPETRAIDAQRN